MADAPSASGEELARLEERLGRLAREKSDLQLIVSLMNKVRTVEGLDGAIGALLGNILDAIGGTNILLYFRVDNDLFLADLLGTRRKVDRIDDALVRQVFETRQPVEYVSDFQDTQMLSPVSSNAFTWVIPVLSGRELVGVLKLENLHVAMREWSDHLPAFFSCVGGVLKNEIFSQTRLKQVLDHSRFLESLDAVSRAIQGTGDVRQMMSDVLDTVLSIFDCDRASLVFPCDPEAPSWRALVERVRQGCSRACANGLDIPVDPGIVQLFQVLREASGPVSFGPGSDRLLPPEATTRFGIQSQLAMALYPKVGRPWMFVVHQCSHPRTWTRDDESLFREIGRRLADGLSVLLADRDLRESEMRYRDVFMNVSDGLFLLEVTEDERLRIIDVNPAFVESVGEPSTLLVGKFVEDAFPEDVARYCLSRFRECVETGSAVDFELEFDRTAGRRFADLTFIPVRDESERICRIAGILRDITERKRAEMELARVSRVQRMLSDSNQALIRTTDEATLLDELCRIAVEVGGYRMAWVGFAEADDAGSVRPVAHAGFESGYLDLVLPKLGDSDRGCNPGVTAIRTGQACLVRNVSENPGFAAWREEALQRGFLSILAMPLIVGTRTIGVLVVWSGEADAFDDREVAVLKELAGDLAFGIVTLRTRGERDRAQAEKALQARISSIFLSVPDDETLDEVLKVVLEVMASPLGAFGYLDESGALVMPTLTRQVWDKCQIPGKTFIFPPDTWGNSTWARAIRERKANCSNEATTRLPEGHIALKRHVSLPVLFHDQVIGIFLVANKETDYTDADVTALEGIARHVAPILSARLRRQHDDEELRRRNDELTALRTIDQNITGSLDLGLMLRVIVEQAITHLKADATAVLLLSPHSLMLEFAAGKGFRSRTFERTRLKMGEGRAGRAALTRRVLGSADLRNEDADVPRDRQPFRTEGFLAHHVAPLVAKGRVVGVLEVFHRTPYEPGTQWMGFFEALAGQTAIAIDSATAFDNLQQTNIALRLSYDATIEGWARALDLRDKETEGHSRRVTELTVRLAQALDFRPDEIVHVQRGALLHDIGKMGIPDAILLKPGPLTDEEWDVMRRHPQLALEMLRPIEHLRPALDIPLCHHEKWDGTGYPRGMRGEQIPLAARIFAVVDVWDALTNDRPYRKAWTPERALDHVREQAGKHFDPRVVKVFLDVVSEDGGQGA